MLVKSFHVPASRRGRLSSTADDMPSTPTSRATVVTCWAKVASVSVMLLIVSASAATSPFASTVRRCFKVAVGDGGHDLDDAAPGR